MDEATSSRAVIEAEKPELRLPVRLSDLRRSMNALTTLLLDQNGRVIAQAGDMPDIDFESRLGHLLVTAIGYGLKVSLMLGKTAPENVMAFHGEAYHLVLAPVNDYVLVLAMDASKTARYLSKVIEEVLVAQKELIMILTEMGHGGKTPLNPAEDSSRPATVNQSMSQPEAVVEPVAPEPEEDMTEFEALFNPSKKAPAVENVDEFWSTAAASHRYGPGSPDRLTFEQAHSLGLTPGEGQ